MEASPKLEAYFASMEEQLNVCYDVATKARQQGFDPEDKVDIPLAKNMAERVEGLISAVKPEIRGSGLSKRIEELEKTYGALALEVAMIISNEVANEKFCKFADKREAMEIGIRVGFAYVTIGVVSAPLEGFTELKIKQRADGKEYLSLMFSGPVRGAGGTAMAFCLVLADYVRQQQGYAPYDPTEQEIHRSVIELDDYHERVTNLQYRPSEEEIEYLIAHCPLQIDGEPTEKLEVSQGKDLPRVETNRIRGGVCLVVSMLALKAPKLLKELDRMEIKVGWDYIKDFVKLQKKKKSKGATATRSLTPDYTFIADLVAGRPVITHPLRYGGLRLRYGRTRMSGYSAAGINPATMIVLDKFIAVGTQLKTERPGKAAAVVSCDSIDGPIVKLKDGSVLRFDTEQQAREYAKEVAEVLYLGDILFSYGDFLDRNHMLVPAGYNEEWHARELEATTKDKTLTAQQKQHIKDYKLHYPHHPTFELARTIAETHHIPLHPRYTYFWTALSREELNALITWLRRATVKDQKLILPKHETKRSLELLGMPHTVVADNIVIPAQDAQALLYSLGASDPSHLPLELAHKDPLLLVNELCPASIKDKAGTFIGARMGRPEKAKMRQLTGNPHVLFPVGEEGGRLRSFQAALEKGVVTAEVSQYKCAQDHETIYRVCHGKKATPLLDETGTLISSKKAIDIATYYKDAAKLLQGQLPELVKGVRGTSNHNHAPEQLIKGILRAKHNISVNKDGTTRYDMSELPITHFKPTEIGSSVEQLRSLGYTTDVKGAPLTSEHQVLELFPQDLILPSSPDAIEDNADAVLLRISQYVDELLLSLYGIEPFYNFKNSKDLIGTLVIGLAPHISAGIVGRVIGFSKTQGMLAHPLYHAAMRRDADGDEACVILLMDAFLNFSRQYLPDSRGAKTMDSPLVLTPRLIPAEVDDMAHRVDRAWKYPLELYEAASHAKMPFDVKIDLIGHHLDTEQQYEGMGYTHETTTINSGVLLSSYKTLPSMQEKLQGQMVIAEKIRAVDTEDVARLVIEKHLLKDIRGNLRKFSTQQFRCVNCNKKFRRPMLQGNCDQCGGRLLFTVSEGSIVKYLEPAISLAEAYVNSPYLLQVLELTKNRIADAFGKDKDKQEGLGKWFASP